MVNGERILVQKVMKPTTQGHLGKAQELGTFSADNLN